MKKFRILIALLFFSHFINAQPGPPFASVNVNDIHAGKINNRKEHYYIDETTDPQKLHLLAEHRELVSIGINTGLVPKEFIEYGSYIKEITISSTNYTSSNNAREALVHDVLNLGMFQSMPELERIFVFGFILDEDPAGAAAQKNTPAPGKPKLLELHDVEIVQLPTELSVSTLVMNNVKLGRQTSFKKNTGIRSISFSEMAITEVPDMLPGQVETLSFEECNSLRSIESLVLYPELKSISIDNCNHIAAFPEHLPQKEFNRISIELLPLKTAELLNAISGVDKIGELHLSFGRGVALLDFKNVTHHFDKLWISGFYSGKTNVSFRNTDHLSVTDLSVSGNFDSIPAFSKIQGLKNLYFHPNGKELKNNSVEELKKIKGLKNFRIGNCNITAIPEVFFSNNPGLEYLEVISTGITELSFGKTVLHKLRQMTIAHNMQLEKIPAKTFYPECYLTLMDNKKKEYK